MVMMPLALNLLLFSHYKMIITKDGYDRSLLEIVFIVFISMCFSIHESKSEDKRLDCGYNTIFQLA